MFTKQDKEDLLNEIAELRVDVKALREERSDLESGSKLKRQVEDLKLEKDRLKEEHARETRETEHMVGLTRKKQEQDAAHQRREIEVERDKAKLEVREENLEAAQDRFDEHIAFQGKRFEAEVGYLKDILGQILDRLPTVTVDKTTAPAAARKRAS